MQHIGWAIFTGDALQYSEPFKQQFSQQLGARFYELLGVKEDKRMPRFALFLGEYKDVIAKDEYCFTLVSVNTFTYSYDMTVYWKLKDEPNAGNAVHSDSLTENNVEFGWCIDFKREELLASLNNRKKLSKTKYKLAFDVEYDYSKYPDLTLSYEFNTTATEKERQAIETVVRESLPGCLVTGLMLPGDNFLTGINFQNMPYKKGINSLMLALQNISGHALASIISKINIE